MRPPAAVLVAALLTVGALIVPSAVSADSAPVARWALDAGSGASVADSIGTANGARSGGSSWITSGAAVGTGAMHFDGVDGRIDVPSMASLEPAQLVLSAWVRGSPLAPPAAGQVIVAKGDFACAGPSYGLAVSTNGIRLNVRLETGDQVTGELSQADAKASLWDGSWHLVSARLVLSGNAVLGYLSIDGSPMIFPVFTGQPGPQLFNVALYSGETTAALGIGANPNPACTGTYFKGDVDDVRIYADQWFDPATLMPPTVLTITGAGPTAAHQGETVNYVAHVSPVPNWGTIRFQRLYNGTWENVVDAQSIAPNGDVSQVGTANLNAGTDPMRAIYFGPAQYTSAGQTFDLDVTNWPTTTTLVVSPSPGAPFQDETLTATVGSDAGIFAQWPEGSVEFYDTTDLSPVLLGTSSLTPTVNYTGTATLHITSLDVGTHKLMAKYIGPDFWRVGSQSTDVSVVIGTAATTVSVAPVGSDVVEAHHAFQLTANVSSTNVLWASSATMTFRKVGTSTPICVVTVDVSNDTRCTVPAQPLGNWQYTAEYSGNSRNLGSTSDPTAIQIVTDVVHATGVGTQYTTFYPVTDKYRDTVGLKGTRGETASVTIKIYSPSGSMLKTVSIASGTGAYNYNWNGRNSAGTIYASGKYKVVQTLKDAAGTTTAVTSYVTLSKKKLYTYTSTITKKGSSLTAKGAAAGGAVKVSTTSGYAKLYAPTLFTSWAGAGWELTLPSATIYKSFYVRVYGRHSGPMGDTSVGAQNFASCPYVAGSTWNVSCFDGWAQLSSTSGTTLHYYKTANLSSSHRAGTKVRVSVSSYYGTTYIYKAQVVVTYQVLK